MASYEWPPQGSGSSSGVTSLNTLTGALTISAGTGISVTPSGSTLTIAATGAGTGTVTSVSVVSANGFAGSVATATTTPSVTISTSVMGVLKGNGTAISAASAGTDYVIPSGSILGTAGNITATSNSTLTTLSSLSLPANQLSGVGNLTDAGTDGIIVTNGGNSVIGTGTSIAQHVADTSHNGYLSSTDWTTFNSKQAGPLTGDATTSGTALTLATVNGNVGTFGSSTAIPIITVNAKGLTTAVSTSVVIAPAGTLSGTTLNAIVVTSSLTSLGTQSSALNMGSHKINNVIDPTNAQDAATKNYVDTVAAGINPAVAVQAATTAAGNTSGFTYNNGVSGIGATFTGSVNTAVTIDGYTFTALGQRLLVKNDTQSPSGAFNGVYYVTQVQTAILAPILTRALDYDQPSDINNTGVIPVINGTVNGTTLWALTSQVNTVGTDPLTFAKFGSSSSGNFGAALYNGGFQNGSGAINWSLSNGTFIDFTASGTPVLTANYNSGIGTVTAAASNLPGITIASAPKTGTLKITANCSSVIASAGDWSIELVDGSNTFINAVSGHENAANAPGAASITGYYDVIASTAYTFKVMGQIISGTLSIGGGNTMLYLIDFSVEYVK